MTEIAVNRDQQIGSDITSAINKPLLATYGIVSYLIGVAGLGGLILSMGGLVPMGGWITLTDNSAVTTAINVLLTGLFGLQHSIMARPFFKQFFQRHFGHPGERATFVWAAGVTMLILLALWQPLPGVVWSAESTLGRGVMWGLFLFGWAYLFAATFAINHFDLFGLRQIWLAINNRPYEPPAFKESWMYRYSRHPIMLGALIGLWCVPEMTVTKLVAALTFTAYIFIGVAFEERDLLAAFGERYADYKRRVGMFFTLGKRD